METVFEVLDGDYIDDLFFVFNKNDDIEYIKNRYAICHDILSCSNTYSKTIGEIYKPIPNYDNYEISNYGNVRKKNTGLILESTFRECGIAPEKCQKCTIINIADYKTHNYVILNNNGIKKKHAVWYLHFLCRTFG